jgi:hypothetical protein
VRHHCAFLKGDGELMVAEVLAHLPQVLLLCLHGDLTSTEVVSVGPASPAPTAVAYDDDLN